MQGFLRRIERFFELLRSFIATILGGTYLIWLYLVTLWLVVGSLSAIQVRDHYDEGTLPFSFGEADTVTAGDYLANAKSRITSALYYGGTSATEAKIWRLAWTLPNDFPNQIDLTQMYSLDDLMDSFEFTTLEEFCVGDVTTGCKKVAQIREDYSTLQDQLAAGQFPTASETEAKVLKELDSLREVTVFVELNSFFKFMEYSFFLNAPREILVMILTIAMGILGSVITMTWSFVRMDNGYSLRRMLMLPFVGCMSAFIILIFLKAGQLTLTAGETTDQLSPFFLSFVGIISGLLSERAYSRMSEVGTSFFAVHEEVMRWGIRLEAAMTAAGLEFRDLAGYLNVDEAKVKDIVHGRASATTSQQQLIGACLRVDPREIFTDQPPRSVEVEEDPPAFVQPAGI